VHSAGVEDSGNVRFRVCTSLVLRIQVMWGSECAHRWCRGFRSCGVRSVHSASVEDSGNVGFIVCTALVLRIQVMWVWGSAQRWC
jgi:hypothetical protein